MLQSATPTCPPRTRARPTTSRPATQWVAGSGRGLDALGINGVPAGSAVTETAMAQVFRDGCDPVTREPLGAPFQRITAGEGRHAVAGYDATFTATKSVSVLWGLADEPTRAALYDAHRAALKSALQF